MWILNAFLKFLLFAFGLLALAFTVVFFLVVGLIMTLLGKKPRVIRMSTNWRDLKAEDFRAAPKDVTPKAFPALDQ